MPNRKKKIHPCPPPPPPPVPPKNLAAGIGPQGGSIVFSKPIHICIHNDQRDKGIVLCIGVPRFPQGPPPPPQGCIRTKRGLRGSPRGGLTGGWRRLPKR